MTRILLAEDDKNFGQVLKNELEEDKYTVDLVDDGVKAVLSFVDHSYALAILDIKMPRLGGNDALKILKRLNPRIPVITISGNAGDSEVAESIKCGALKCLVKPFRVEHLMLDIERCLKEQAGHMGNGKLDGERILSQTGKGLPDER